MPRTLVLKPEGPELDGVPIFLEGESYNVVLENDNGNREQYDIGLVADAIIAIKRARYILT
jgi:hypothetical protein